MIEVNICDTKGWRKEVHYVDENRTPRSVLEEFGFYFYAECPALNGCALLNGEIDKTFAQHGVTDRCFLCIYRKMG